MVIEISGRPIQNPASSVYNKCFVNYGFEIIDRDLDKITVCCIPLTLTSLAMCIQIYCVPITAAIFS